MAGINGVSVASDPNLAPLVMDWANRAIKPLKDALTAFKQIPHDGGAAKL